MRTELQVVLYTNLHDFKRIVHAPTLYVLHIHVYNKTYDNPHQSGSLLKHNLGVNRNRIKTARVMKFMQIRHNVPEKIKLMAAEVHLI